MVVAKKYAYKQQTGEFLKIWFVNEEKYLFIHNVFTVLLSLFTIVKKINVKDTYETNSAINVDTK